MFSKKRREHNTKRVGEAFRGDKWSPEQSHVTIIERTKDKVEPKNPDSGSPHNHVDRKGPKDKPNHNPPHNPHNPEIKPKTTKPQPEERSPKTKPNEYPKGPNSEPPHGGISPKPKPVGPKPGLPGRSTIDHDISKQKPANYQSPYTVTRKK
jgi:hypothetical protein